jgi:PPOX class probable F420-dependent enzyme
MRLTAGEALRWAAAADHGILGTLRDGEGPDLVPVCFAIEGNHLAIPVDRVKPKASPDLQRIRNLMADNRATLLVEQWDADDWDRLWWVRLRLEAASFDGRLVGQLAERLRERYVRYRTASFERLLTFNVIEVTGWAAAEHSPSPLD